MNRKTKKGYTLPSKIDSFYKTGDGYFAEYDGFHFEGKTHKNVVNQILKYIFAGGEE
jgi:hypothetical protein